MDEGHSDYGVEAMANWLIVETENGEKVLNLDNVAYAEIGDGYANLFFSFTGEWIQEGTAEHIVCVRGEDFERFMERVRGQA